MNYELTDHDVNTLLNRVLDGAPAPDSVDEVGQT
jgi:hypothetical protein